LLVVHSRRWRPRTSINIGGGCFLGFFFQWLFATAASIVDWTIQQNPTKPCISTNHVRTPHLKHLPHMYNISIFISVSVCVEHARRFVLACRHFSGRKCTANPSWDLASLCKSSNGPHDRRT
ncbi:hypothetical protein T02_15300, partial [Trichinella nativa]